MENPIGYGSLFNESDIRGGLERLVSEITKAKNDIDEQLKGIKTSASDAFGALSGTSSSTKGGQESIKNYSAQIEQLTTLYNQQKAELDKLTESLDKLNKKKASAPDSAEKTRREVEAFKQLTNEERQVYLVAKQLVTTKKELAAIDRDVVKVAREQEGSYNRLAATYNLATAALKAMTTEQRANTEQGKMLTKIAADSMAQMKVLSAQYGKHTLDVGNYAKAVEGLSEKALNGLYLSTQQIVREMPTLANSASQFFVAISNNVPLFVDAFKRAREESGSFKTALMGTLKSLVSWQTALLVVLTILPKLAKAIHDKRKAQQEDNKTMEDAVKYANLLAKAYREIDKAVVQNTSALKTHYAISQDYQRSMEDRIKAGEILKEQYKDAFENYTAEEIALGRAKQAYDELTKSLVLQAKHRAYLNKIQSLQEQMIDQKALRDQTKAEKDAADAMVARREKEMESYAKASEKMIGAGGQEFAAFSDRLSKAQTAQEKANAEFMKADMAIQDIDNAILKLIRDMPVEGVIPELLTGRGRKGKDVRMKDYYWDYLRSVAEAMDEGVDREMELSRISYAKKIESYYNDLEELRKTGKLKVEQEEQINGIINNLIEAGVKTRWSIIWKWYDKNWQEIRKKYLTEVRETLVDEEDMSLSAPFEKMLSENGKQILESSDRLNEKLKLGTLKEAKEEGAIYKNLIKEKLTLEEQLAEARLKMDLDTGLITQAAYDAQIADLRVKLDKAISKLEQKRRPKFSIWNLIFGEKRTDGNGNVWLEMTPEMKAFTDSIEKTADYALNYMDKWLDYRLKIAEEAVKAAEREADAAKSALDIEQEARANGYANNVEFARREYEKKMELEKKALEQKQKYQRAQDALSSASQAASMSEAIANMWAAYTKGNIFGAILAGTATAAALASFTAAKISAYKASKVTYGEGGYEYMNYGGSHASGHDIDFGRTRDGRPRRVERGEMVGIINKKNVAKYGVGTIGSVIDSLNNGTFEMADKYSLAFQGSNLTTLENGVNALVEQGKEKVVTTPWGRIEYSGNVKRIIKN